MVEALNNLKLNEKNCTWETYLASNKNVDELENACTRINDIITEIYDLAQKISTLETNLSNIELTSGPVGPQGPVGNDGPQGPQGDKGDDATCDDACLTRISDSQSVRTDVSTLLTNSVTFNNNISNAMCTANVCPLGDYMAQKKDAFTWNQAQLDDRLNQICYTKDAGDSMQTTLSQDIASINDDINNIQDDGQAIKDSILDLKQSSWSQHHKTGNGNGWSVKCTTPRGQYIYADPKTSNPYPNELIKQTEASRTLSGLIANELNAHHVPCGSAIDWLTVCRVAKGYAGTKANIIEDLANPVCGGTDGTSTS